MEENQKGCFAESKANECGCCTSGLYICVFPFQNHRDIGKDKDKCDGGEDEDGKEQNTPRGRKTANSQGRRKGRITTRSMANEAASVAAEEAPLSAPEPTLPDPPQLPKPDPAQKAMKESAKAHTLVANVDGNKGESSWAYPLEFGESISACILVFGYMCIYEHFFVQISGFPFWSAWCSHTNLFTVLIHFVHVFYINI